MVNGSELFGGHYRVVKCRMHGGKNIDIGRVCKQPCCPGNGLQNTAMKIGFTAVTNPARDGQHKFYPGIIAHFHQPDVVVPIIAPAFLDLGDRHASGTIGGKNAELELVVVKHYVALSMGELHCIATAAKKIIL